MDSKKAARVASAQLWPWENVSILETGHRGRTLLRLLWPGWEIPLSVWMSCPPMWSLDAFPRQSMEDRGGWALTPLSSPGHLLAQLSLFFLFFLFFCLCIPPAPIDSHTDVHTQAHPILLHPSSSLVNLLRL